MKASDPSAAESRGNATTSRRTATVRRKGNGPDGPMVHDAADAREQFIRETAYAFYEARGRADGFALEDWLRAEAQFSTSH